MTDHVNGIPIGENSIEAPGHLGPPVPATSAPRAESGKAPGSPPWPPPVSSRIRVAPSGRHRRSHPRRPSPGKASAPETATPGWPRTNGASPAGHRRVGEQQGRNDGVDLGIIHVPFVKSAFAHAQPGCMQVTCAAVVEGTGRRSLQTAFAFDAPKHRVASGIAPGNACPGRPRTGRSRLVLSIQAAQQARARAEALRQQEVTDRAGSSEKQPSRWRAAAYAERCPSFPRMGLRCTRTSTFAVRSWSRRLRAGSSAQHLVDQRIRPLAVHSWPASQTSWIAASSAANTR